MSQKYILGRSLRVSLLVETTMANASITMDDLLASADASVKQLTAGEIITGKVLTLRKHEVLIDLGAQGVGFVPRREIGFSRSLNEGDEVTASVVDAELDNGYSLLSLRKAAKDRGWEEVAAKQESGEIIEVTPYDANRGGMLVEFEGVRGFLPVSQLSAEHYPRVGSSDKDEILQRLNSPHDGRLHGLLADKLVKLAGDVIAVDRILGQEEVVQNLAVARGLPGIGAIEDVVQRVGEVLLDRLIELIQEVESLGRDVLEDGAFKQGRGQGVPQQLAPLVVKAQQGQQVLLHDRRHPFFIAHRKTCSNALIMKLSTVMS